MKKIIPVNESYRILSNGPLLLVVTLGDESRPEVSTVAWSTPIESDPPRLAVIVDDGHRTWENLRARLECTLNIVSRDLIPAAVYAGTVSSRERDKLKDLGLLTVAGSVIKTPILPACLANIECRIISLEPETGLVLLEPLAAYADEEAFFAGWKLESGIYPVQHLGGERFQVGSELVVQKPLKTWPPKG